jgi:hypothetical protein
MRSTKRDWDQDDDEKRNQREREEQRHGAYRTMARMTPAMAGTMAAIAAQDFGAPSVPRSRARG